MLSAPTRWRDCGMCGSLSSAGRLAHRLLGRRNLYRSRHQAQSGSDTGIPHTWSTAAHAPLSLPAFGALPFGGLPFDFPLGFPLLGMHTHASSPEGPAQTTHWRCAGFGLKATTRSAKYGGVGAWPSGASGGGASAAAIRQTWPGAPPRPSAYPRRGPMPPRPCPLRAEGLWRGLFSRNATG